MYFEYFLNLLSKTEYNPAHTLVIQNNTMQIIHANRTLRVVCGFLDMRWGVWVSVAVAVGVGVGGGWVLFDIQ